MNGKKRNWWYIHQPEVKCNPHLKMHPNRCRACLHTKHTFCITWYLRLLISSWKLDFLTTFPNNAESGTAADAHGQHMNQFDKRLTQIKDVPFAQLTFESGGSLVFLFTRGK